MRFCFVEDAADNVDPVRAAVEGEFRLGAALARQAGHAFRIDIRRIGNNKIITRGFRGREQIATQQPHAFLQAMIGDIFTGNLDGVFRKLDRIDLRFGKAQRGEDREAPRAGTRTAGQA